MRYVVMVKEDTGDSSILDTETGRVVAGYPTHTLERRWAHWLCEKINLDVKAIPVTGNVGEWYGKEIYDNLAG